jgi:hypothetical protein
VVVLNTQDSTARANTLSAFSWTQGATSFKVSTTFGTGYIGTLSQLRLLQGAYYAVATPNADASYQSQYLDLVKLIP